MSHAPDIMAAGVTEADRLRQVIIDALAAMDRGEYGTARRLLQTGNGKPPTTSTRVIALGAA